MSVSVMKLPRGLLQDETCFFLALDFDKGSWREDAAAFLATCHRLSVPAALERSRSGGGGHVWIFFDSAIPAAWLDDSARTC